MINEPNADAVEIFYNVDFRFPTKEIQIFQLIYMKVYKIFTFFSV